MHKPIWAHKSYTYTIIHFTRKYVFVRIRHLKRTSRTRTQTLIYAKKTYSYAQVAYSEQVVYLRRNPYNLRKASYRAQNPYSLHTQTATAASKKLTRKEKNILSVMARGEQVKSTQVNHDWTKARKVTAPISLEDFMEKEVQL